MKMNFSHNEKGSMKASFEPKQTVLSEFLEGDVQGAVPYCREILDEALSVKMGNKPNWAINGNAYSLTVTKEKALLEGRWEKIKLELPINDFMQAVSGWLAFLESPRR